MKVNLVIGDWSDDGHGKTRIVCIKHNLVSNACLRTAYGAGSLELNHVVPYYNYDDKARAYKPTDDILAHICAEYEDASVPEDIAEKLIAHGIKPSIWDGEGWSNPDGLYEQNEEENEVKYYLGDYENFARLYMEIAKLVQPDLEYSLVEFDHINIGGYGML